MPSETQFGGREERKAYTEVAESTEFTEKKDSGP
jgi:hypothetical protein